MEKYLFPAFMLMAQAIVLLIGLVKTKRGRSYNPHPPGQAATCIEHTAILSAIKSQVIDIRRRLDRIEKSENGK